MNQSEDIPYEMIEHYFFTGKYEEAIELVKEKLPSNIDNYLLWYTLGHSNYALGKYDEAEEQLREAMNLGFDAQVVFDTLGHLYMDTGQWREAENSFLEVLRLNPSNANTHASYAKLMKITGHRKKSKFLIEKAIALDPENPDVLRYYLVLEGVNGNKEQRILALQQYMDSADSELAKLLKLGWNASLQHKQKEAKEYYRQAFVLNPENRVLLSILEEMDISTHPLLAPNRIIKRMGGMGIVWVTVILISLLLELFGIDSLRNRVFQLLLLLTLYVLISVPLVKGLRNMKSYRR